MKAFATDYLDANAIVLSASHAKARYSIYLSAKDAGYMPILTKIRVWRAREYDDGNTILGKKAEPNKPYGIEYMVKNNARK